MSLIIKNAVIIDGQTGPAAVKQDLQIEDGKVKKIGVGLDGKESIDVNGAYVTAGLFDNWSHFCEPGLEHKEDINSGLSAAMQGGYTDVVCLPNTSPAVDSKSQLNFLLKSSSDYAVKLYPYACVSQGGRNEVISEMHDLHQNGAIAFTGGVHPITNAELLMKSLQYASSFGGLIVNRPLNLDLSGNGQMHEGEVSTRLGMKGVPSMAEKIAIERDLSILAYAGGKLHLSGISTKEGVSLIRKAKSEGLGVTCDVPIHNLIYTENDLDSYNSNFKLDPPLRSFDDQEALIEGILDDTIDCIASYHIPQDIESKELEFNLADCGMISLQTVIPQLLMLKKRIPLQKLIHKISNAARAIYGRPEVKFEEGAEARFTIIDPTRPWVFNAVSNQSKAINSSLFGKDLLGKATGLVIGNQYISLVE
ncbi:MAG: dihydroorotase [Cyclobacteriaceae bacterium]